MKRTQIKLCIIGFGNAAKAFCQILNDKADEIEKTYGYKVIVTAIAGRSKGSMIDASGIALEKMLASIQKTGKLSAREEDLIDCQTNELIEGCNADVMIELSTLSITDGQPAIRHIEKAFVRGLHVITANKGPIAWDFERLSTMADKLKRIFLYETIVMDGTPIFNLVRETLPGCKVLSFKGILNSTTNFILEEMERGATYDDAVKEAQRRGFAEADPSLDVDGWDAAAKTTAIANVILKAKLKPTDIDRTGIGGITIEEIKEAGLKNKKIKLLCEGYMENGKAIGKVHPVLVDRNDIFSHIDATSSALSITTDMMGEIYIIEKDPEIEQTAYGIYSDLLTLLKRLKYEQ
jgi:homoserine dehydrogenase